ncbi:MarR family winged helix-turn-helix transcriptional regulator [Micromonospora sp. NBC_01412]|uniref:MarR family winged helix-turn-helix transcriptional regulator n=1 Tax=Micromonospora sp. NBC_01412 TaxID=2903590 RepID=UPI00324F18C7
MQWESSLDELESALATVLRLLADRATVGDVARRSGYDLPPASWSLLEHLAARGALRVSDIAACHGVDISSVTPRLKRLETAGLVTRSRLPTDARAFLISITDEGVHALESVHAARRDILKQALDGIDAAQLAVATGVLSRVAHRLAVEPAQPA